MEAEQSQKWERTRASIFEAAAKVVGTKGFAAATLSDIAKEAGLKAGSLYYHFDSKEELVAEVLRFTIERTERQVRAAVEELPDEATPGERLRIAIRAHLHGGQGPYRAAYVRMISQVSPEVRREQFRVERSYGRYLAKLFEEARDSGEIRSDIDSVTARLLVIGALNWMVEWPPAALRNRDAVASAVEKLIFEGLSPRAATGGDGPRGKPRSQALEDSEAA